LIPAVPATRIRVLRDEVARPERDYVLYWATCARRTRWSFALQHAARLSQELGRPLLVLEALRVGYEHASDRLHAFILQGMQENVARADAAGVTWLPYVEPEAAHGRGLLSALAARACVVITDEPTTFFLPRMLRAAAARIDARLEVVDGAGVLPRVATDRAFPTAHSFRRHLQRVLPEHLGKRPVAEPLAGLDAPRARVSDEIAERWPRASAGLLSADRTSLASLPIDHDVSPVELDGGAPEGEKVLARFLAGRLARYDQRSHPDEESASGLSPWLHFGHISPHEVVHSVLEHEGWTPDRAARNANGSRSGYWGLPPAIEGFLDEMITWRELGNTWAWHRPDDHAEYSSVPDWARQSLAQHAQDEREYLYTRAQLEAAETHDEVWNAAQRQLLREGRIDNYPRMLWGKNVLAWSRTPEEAAVTLKALNDRWAIDGRDANSYSGIYWVFGRHDRAWGPERPVFGKVRYMTSANTKRKLRMRRWLERFAATPAD
jgi:deoxyribodipyrimidine photo-lyase